MAMLAEPRRKQKWTLNPRGKQWSDDSNKFGQKMLEKMGWTSGKGLGAKEQGMTDHVRVSYKDDNAGIGFKKDKMNEAWTETQEGFNDFLQELQKSQGSGATETAEPKTEVLSGKSLELKSKQSRARVHYKKFTRGKDVNKYSSKDLANIFGQKELGVNNNAKEEQAIEVDNSDPIGKEDDMNGVKTIHGGNMNDYFKKKGQNFAKVPQIKKEQSDSESEQEYVGFGFNPGFGNAASNYAFENPCLRLNSPQSPSDENRTPKKRKIETPDESNLNNSSKKLKEDSCKNGFVNSALNLESQPNESCNGKEFEVSRAQFGLSNCALDITDESAEKKRVTFSDHVEYSTDSVKKKKGKATLDKFEVENKKHKRKRKHEDTQTNSVPSGFVNEALDIEDISDEVNDNEVNERKSKKAKKRKESRKSNLETIIEAPEEDKEACEGKMKTDENILESSTNDMVLSKENAGNKDRKKKKKKKKEKVIEEICLSDSEEDVKKTVKNNTPDEEETENIQEKDVEGEPAKTKKKKKKSKQNADVSIEEVIIVPSEIEEDVTCLSTKDVECSQKEVSDKENAESDQTNTAKAKKPKKSKKHRKSIDQSTLDADTPTRKAEPVKSLNVEESTVETNGTSTPSKKPAESNAAFHGTRSPWSAKHKMTKKILKSFFNRNSVQHFPGSNILEIKGYGADRP